MWINLPGLSLLLTICALCGMVVFAEYRHCDPIKAGRIQGRDQVGHFTYLLARVVLTYFILIFLSHHRTARSSMAFLYMTPWTQFPRLPA